MIKKTWCLACDSEQPHLISLQSPKGDKIPYTCKCLNCSHENNFKIKKEDLFHLKTM